LIVQRVALSGKAVDIGIHLAHMKCELSIMYLHNLSASAIAEAESKIAVVQSELNSINSLIESLPQYPEREDAWSALPLPIRRSGLASLCALEEYILEQNPLNDRVSRYLKSTSRPFFYNLFNLI
jgi:hypothetical protein